MRRKKMKALAYIIENSSLFQNIKVIKALKNVIASSACTWNITNIIKSESKIMTFKLNIANKCKLMWTYWELDISWPLNSFCEKKKYKPKKNSICNLNWIFSLQLICIPKVSHLVAFALIFPESLLEEPTGLITSTIALLFDFFSYALWTLLCKIPIKNDFSPVFCSL